LLDATVDYVAEHGFAELRLRTLAAALGTSHRMLLYHFGSKEELLVEVVRAVEARQRTALASLMPTPDQSPVEFAREFWARVSDPALWQLERLFFEMYSQALQHRPGTSAVLNETVEAWVGPLTEWSTQAGFPADVARNFARLGVAVTRGLLLDLLATGDRAAVDASMETFIASYEAALNSYVRPQA
jgi:AcrR family transcriptional regulator